MFTLNFVHTNRHTKFHTKSGHTNGHTNGKKIGLAFRDPVVTLNACGAKCAKDVYESQNNWVWKCNLFSVNVFAVDQPAHRSHRQSTHQSPPPVSPPGHWYWYSDICILKIIHMFSDVLRTFMYSLICLSRPGTSGNQVGLSPQFNNITGQIISMYICTCKSPHFPRRSEIRSDCSHSSIVLSCTVPC